MAWPNSPPSSQANAMRGMLAAARSRQGAQGSRLERLLPTTNGLQPVPPRFTVLGLSAVLLGTVSCPVRGPMAREPPGASLTMVSVPLKLPSAAGLKCMTMLHDAPTASDEPQSLVMVNGPATVMLLMVSGPLPVLVIGSSSVPASLCSTSAPK